VNDFSRLSTEAAILPPPANVDADNAPYPQPQIGYSPYAQDSGGAFSYVENA
jgi:hypothetical protein